MKTLREILKEKGIGQKVVADALGVHVNVIARYDDLSKRSLDEVLTVSEATGIPVEELTGFKVGTVVDFSKNSGGINAGIIGGRNAIIANSTVNRLISEDVRGEAELSTDSLLHIIEGYKEKIMYLERVISAKDDLIKILQNKS